MNQKSKDEKLKAAEQEASRDGWKPNITLSVCFLSVCLLPVCLSVHFILSYRGRKEKSVSPRMAVGTKGSAIRTHQQQTFKQRDRQVRHRESDKQWDRQVRHTGWQTDRQRERRRRRSSRVSWLLAPEARKWPGSDCYTDLSSAGEPSPQNYRIHLTRIQYDWVRGSQNLSSIPQTWCDKHVFIGWWVCLWFCQ